MNKHLLKHMAMLVALFFAAMAFTACSNDGPDDGENDGDADDIELVSPIYVIAVGDEVWTLDKAYYEVLNGTIRLMFVDCDINEYPRTGHELMVDLPADGNEVPTGTWPYAITPNPGYRIKAYYGSLMTAEVNSLDGSVYSGDMRITKNGDEYEVLLPDIVLEGEFKGSWKQFHTAYWYRGKLERYEEAPI